jgi:hypothetical protein
MPEPAGQVIDLEVFAENFAGFVSARGGYWL